MYFSSIKQYNKQLVKNVYAFFILWCFTRQEPIKKNFKIIDMWSAKYLINMLTKLILEVN